MKILVNGKEHILKDDSSIQELLKDFNLDDGQVIIQVDNEIITSSTLKTTRIKNGSEIEIMAIVGGG